MGSCRTGAGTAHILWLQVIRSLSFVYDSFIQDLGREIDEKCCDNGKLTIALFCYDKTACFVNTFLFYFIFRVYKSL